MLYSHEDLALMSPEALKTVLETHRNRLHNCVLKRQQYDQAIANERSQIELVKEILDSKKETWIIAETLTVNPNSSGK